MTYMSQESSGMLFLFKETIAIIRPKFFLFFLIYLQGTLLLSMVAVIGSFVATSKSLFDLTAGISVLLISALFALSYLNASNIYLAVVKKDHYHFMDQLRFVGKNFLKLAVIRFVVALVSIFIMMLLIWVVYSDSQKIDNLGSGIFFLIVSNTSSTF